MTYFVTGGTGFIGRFLIDRLVQRKGTIHVLVRKGSARKLGELRTRWNVDETRVVAVVGNLAKPKLGLAAADIAKLKGKVQHFFHLAAIYDLAADAASQEAANVEGTRSAVELAEAIQAGCFHHVSSIAAAGLYDGDFERTMQLNYFGSLRLIMGFPHMVKQVFGHVINISSIGVLTRAPRFSAYVASKAALDAFSECAASEFVDDNVHFTTINMPLVRTPMIAPTTLCRTVPTLSAGQAADLVVEAIVYKPVRIATRLGVFGQVLHAVAPKATQIILNTAFRMFPDSGAAKGGKGEAREVELTPEQVAFAQITQGIHW